MQRTTPYLAQKGTQGGRSYRNLYSKALDTEYLELAKDPEKNKARLEQMVREAATSAGYTEEVYHGSTAKKIFNVFRTGGGQYGEGIYATYDGETASNVYGKNGVTLHLFAKIEKMADYPDIYRELGMDDFDSYDDYAKSIGFDDFDDMTSDWKTDPTNPEGNPRIVEALIEKGFDSFYDEGNAGFVIWAKDGYEAKVKFADPVTYDDNGNVIPLSERFNEKKLDMRYSRSIANYTEEQYNSYGWTIANGVLNYSENENWKSKLSYLVGTNNFVKSESGSTIIPVGKDFGVDNVLVYTTGTFDNPEIEKVVRINTKAYGKMLSETDLDVTRREVYDYERQHYWDAAEVVEGFYRKGYIKIYRPEMFVPYEAYERIQKGKTRIGDRTLSRYVDGRRVKSEVRFDDETGNPKWSFREGEGYTRYSRAITEVEYNKLNRKYDAAVKLAEYWRKETKTSTPHIRESDIRKFTARILKYYSSTLKFKAFCLLDVEESKYHERSLR